MRLLVPLPLPVHQTASCSHSHISKVLFPWAWKPASTNGCIFSGALCHKMILLSLFSEMGNGIAELGRSTLQKASANLKEHQAWFFRALVSIALCVVTALFPFDCICSSESFTPVSGRSEQRVISARHWGAWPDQRHTWKLPSEVAQAGTSLKKLTAESLDGKYPLSYQQPSMGFSWWPIIWSCQGLHKNKSCFSMNSSLLERCKPPRLLQRHLEKLQCENQSCGKHRVPRWEAALQRSARCDVQTAMHCTNSLSLQTSPRTWPWLASALFG